MAVTIYKKNSVATSNNASTTTGAGAVFVMPDYSGSPPSKFTWQTLTTGGPTGVSITLQGSIDGTNWYTIDTSTATGGEVRAVVDKPAKYVRTNLGTLTGGAAPTVTGQFMAAQ